MSRIAEALSSSALTNLSSSRCLRPVRRASIASRAREERDGLSRGRREEEKERAIQAGRRGL